MAVMQTPRPWLGLLAGALAGLVASAAMEAAQSALGKLKDDNGGQGGEDDPATVKAADAVSRAATGEPVAKPYREPAGRVVHYMTGAALGAVYGFLVEYRPGAAAGFGSAYGAAVSAILDEMVVPAAGLGSAPWDAPVTTHLIGLAAHLVFGISLEAGRRLVAGRA